MEIKINNKNDIVDGAFFEEVPLSFNLYINTIHCRVRPNSTLTCIDEGIKTWTYYTENGNQYDEVTLIAENDHDKKILSRLSFELMAKNQLWILMPKMEVYTKII